MITSAVPLNDGSGQYAFKSFCLAFSPDARLVHKFGAGPLTATKAVPDVPKRDGQPVYAQTPIGDHLGDDNKPTFASLHAIANASRCPDFGFATDCVRDGSIRPDTKLRGVAAWKTGPSANDAANTLARLWAKHVAASTVPQNRKPVVRPN